MCAYVSSIRYCFMLSLMFLLLKMFMCEYVSSIRSFETNNRDEVPGSANHPPKHTLKEVQPNTSSTHTYVCGAGRLIQETTDLHAVLGLASIATMKQQPNPINPHLWVEPTDCVFDCGSYRFCRCPGQGLFATMSPTSNWIHTRTCVRNLQIDSHRFPRCPPWAQSQLCHVYMPMAIHPARIEVATFSVLGWRHSH